jgi:hypothetical protein
MSADHTKGPTAPPLITIALLAAVAIVTAGFAWPQAQTDTRFRIAPKAPWVRIGKTLVVDLVMEQVNGLYGVEVHLSFDPQVFQVVDAAVDQPGIQIEPGELPFPDFVVVNRVDNTMGTIDYAVTQMQPREPASGDGIVARVILRAQQAATSPIKVSSFLLANTTGQDIEAVALPAEIQVRDYSVPIVLAVGGFAALLVLGALGWAYKRRK